ncbi:transporter substrate-binding domain-containing protein [Pseudomonas sp. PDM19]|nr:transporter substrate-binding domain-containing protein [Pseudomonas sp. PDM19]
MRCKVLFSFFALLVSSVCSANSYSAPRTIQLLGHSVISQQELSLSDEDWRWLRQKKKLVLGVTQWDYVPFDVTVKDGLYEGITADVIGMVGQLLNIPVEVKLFPDRVSAVSALRNYEIDLLATANDYDASIRPLNLSSEYVLEDSALFSRLNERRKFGNSFSGLKVATANDYLPVDVLRGALPGANFQFFDSRQQALAALAFGHVDLYLGDWLSSNLLINQGYFNYVKLERDLNIYSGGVSFALSPDNLRLLEIINKAIAAIKSNQIDSIMKRWGGGTGIAVNSYIEWTSAEKKWISNHPRLRILVSNDQAPIAFEDDNGNFNGVVADLIKMVTMHTGVQFDISYTDQLSDLSKPDAFASADLVILTPSEEREGLMRFSYPFLSAPIAIITRKNDDVHIDEKSLHGAHAAIPQGQLFIKMLQSMYPGNPLTTTPSLLEAMDLVAHGDADFTTAGLNVAQYYTTRMFDKKLRIINVLGPGTSNYSFAMSRGNTELQTILNKVLESIPPDEMNVIGTRWRANVVSRDKTWLDYRMLIYQVSAVIILLILVSLIWNSYLQRQIVLRKKFESKLDDQLRFKQALINGTPHPIYVRDRGGKLVSCNDSYLQIFGLKRDQVIGRSGRDEVVSNASEALGFHDDYMRVMSDGQPLEQDCTIEVSGKTLSIYHWIQPYRNLSGEILGVICGWIDISERHDLVEQLQAAKDEADSASRAKTTFLATMSHEIRTPMNAVIGMLELSLKQADQGKFDQGAIEIAYDAARGLLELIGDILDIVRIESGHLNVSPKRANLQELVASVVRVFDGLARQKSLTLCMSVSSNINTDVLIDPVRFKQVLSNLISNAIKFTEQGQVDLNIQGEYLEDDLLHVILQVKDTGIGISEDDQQRLFQPFAQAEQPVHISRGGTGLGLVICRSLCNMMGGTLSLESTLGEGTTVIVELTLNTLYPLPNEELELPLQNGVSNQPLRILVVDDHPANRLLMTRQLAYLGHQIKEAVDGAQGFEVWREGAFDVVITDCNMPVMSGYDLTRKIREVESSRDMLNCTVLGFTANAQSDAVDRCKEAGMNDCMFKPISLATLSVVLSQISPINPLVDLDSEGNKSPSALFNLEEPERLTGHDPALINMLLAELLSTNRSDLEKLLNLASSAKDHKGLSDLAHRIKGAARMIQAQKLVQACEAMQSICDVASPSEQAIIAQSKNLERAVHDLEIAINEYLDRKAIADE